MRNIVLATALLISMAMNAQTKAQYTNPILAGFYPDPSICRVGPDYYLVNSSFAYFPGLPLFHSRDLVNWRQIGHAMDRPEQLDLAGAGVSRGLFAPAITHHKGTYYIVCTLIDKGGNFVITAKDPAGPWSNPVWLREVEGIDPSLFFDEDDRAYIVYNSIPPDNKSLWDGHRTIRMRAFDYHALKVTGEEILLVNGGTDMAKKPVWIEAPHIYRINGAYYLMCAEGGTGYHHSEVVFKSSSVWGPYIPYEKNPILTQRLLDPGRKHPITTAGHADMVETPTGQWYAVFLGARPYEGPHFNTGRETFLAPVTWQDGWPIITKEEEVVQYHYPLPQGVKTFNNPYSGNFTFRDDFTGKTLEQRYLYLRTVTENWYSTTEKNGHLTLKLRPETVSGTANPSLVAFRQQHLRGTATTSLEFLPKRENEKAGLLIFQSEHHFYYLCQSLKEGQPVVQLFQSTSDGNMKLLAEKPLPKTIKQVQLKLEAKGATYAASYATDNKNWLPLKEDLDARFLSTETAGGFVGCVFGLYATSLGQPSTSKAHYDWFKYQGNDEVYKPPF